MKKWLFISIFAASLLGVAIAQTVTLVTVPCSIASVSAGSTVTNTPFASLNLDQCLSPGRENCRISVQFSSGSVSSNVIFYFVASVDGTSFESADRSNIKISVIPNGAATLKTDWFNLVGVRKLALSKVENNSGTSITGLAVKLGYGNANN